MPNIIFGIVCVVAGAFAMLIPETNNLEMADQLCDVEEQKVVTQHEKRARLSRGDLNRESQSSSADAPSQSWYKFHQMLKNTISTALTIAKNKTSNQFHLTINRFTQFYLRTWPRKHVSLQGCAWVI